MIGTAHKLSTQLDNTEIVESTRQNPPVDDAEPDRFQFVVSGSSAHLLSGELSTVLTGRHITVELFPFAFSESLRLEADQTVADLHRGGFGFPDVLVELEDPDSDR